MTAWENAAENPALGFIDEVLRGCGQVMFQNSPITGLLFFIGLFAGGWEFGAYAVLATAVATATAHWIGVPKGLIKAGLYGFNATLVGVGLAFYLDNDWLLAVYVVVGAIAVVFVTAAMANFLGAWNVPTLTAPFVVTTGLMTAASFGFSELNPSSFSPAASLPVYGTVAGRESLSASDLYHGLFNGVGQVFFQDKIVVAVIFLIAILASSHLDCMMAIIGSAVGIGTAYALGVPADSISLGLQGYSAVLTMMALAGLFYVLQINSFIVGIIAAALTVVVASALTAIVAPFGGHIFTAPFVIVTWAFIAASPFLENIQAVKPADATTVEGNINVYRKSPHWWDKRRPSDA
jgi:urea transporter